MQDLKVLFNLIEDGKTRTSDWKWKLRKFEWEIRQKYLTMRVINLWKAVGSAQFSIPCYHLIKAEVSWEEILSLLQAWATRAHTGIARWNLMSHNIYSIRQEKLIFSSGSVNWPSLCVFTYLLDLDFFWTRPGNGSKIPAVAELW